MDKIQSLLINSANPNWINTKQEIISSGSVLSRYVYMLGFFDDPDATIKGVKAIGLLFEHGAKIQDCDRAILYWPITSGQHDIIRLLLENGASATSWPKKEIGSYYTGTPIREATARGHTKVIDLLVEYGAKRLPEKEAIQIRFIHAAKWEYTIVLKELVEKGANVNVKNQDNETALLNAVNGNYHRESYLKTVYLLDLGADVNQNGAVLHMDNTTPLHRAIALSSYVFKREKETFPQKEYAEKIIKALLDKGAYVSGRDGQNSTPLHIAAKYDNILGARMLIEAGAKLMDRDNEGKTPLDYAKSAEMIKLLRTHGAKEL